MRENALRESREKRAERWVMAGLIFRNFGGVVM